MSVTSTGARLSALAAARPPNPPPTISTRCLMRPFVRPGLDKSVRGAVGAAGDPRRPVDQLAQHVEVDVDEVLEVQAALAGLVRAQLVEELPVPVREAAQQVQDQTAVPGREAD